MYTEFTLRPHMTGKTPTKKSTKQQHAEQEIQAGDGSVAIGGSITDSAIIHGQTIVLADRFWRDLQACPTSPEQIKEATAAYLAYLTDRHYYLSLKGMGVSDRVPLKLKLLESVCTSQSTYGTARRRNLEARLKPCRAGYCRV
jgi:hypothetical protein